MKIENWNGHEIRFVEKDGEWKAVLKDVADALSLRVDGVKARLPKGSISNGVLPTSGGPQTMLLIDEFGIYDAVFQSRKKEAQNFRLWVYETLRLLRQAIGLEGFQIFRMLDKEHQKEAMQKLRNSLREPVRIDYIKANVIANKAVSIRYGHPKMVKKSDMTPDMLMDRQRLLDDTVELMRLKDKYRLDFSVSDRIYDSVGFKYNESA